MAEPLGPSFIPKQNPAKVVRRATTRQIYLLTVVSYAVFFATLIAVVVLFVYGRLITKTLTEAVAAYNSEIASFNQDTMREVLELNERLIRVNELLGANISLRAALAAIERETIDTMRFDKLQFERGENNQIMFDATVVTDNFDSVLFQREIYERTDRIAGVSMEDVTIEFTEADAESGVPGRKKVGFSALFNLAPESIQYQPELAIEPAGIGVANQSRVVPTSTPPTAPTSFEVATSTTP